MRPALYAVLLFLLILAESIGDSRSPCYWRTACHATCKQVAWATSRLLITGRKLVIGQYCKSTIAYASTSLWNPRRRGEELCNIIFGRFEKADIFKPFKKESDTKEHYFTEEEMKEFLNDILRICGDICKDDCGKKKS